MNFFQFVKNTRALPETKKNNVFLRLTPELFRFNANNLTTGDRRQGD